MTQYALVAMAVAAAIWYVIRRGRALLGICAGQPSGGCHGCPGACHSSPRGGGLTSDVGTVRNER